MTNQSKHTPGPWKARGGMDEAFIDAPHIVCLAVVNSLDGSRKQVAECMANARLIAQAPALKTVLVTLALEATHYRDTGKGKQFLTRAIDAANAELAKL